MATWQDGPEYAPLVPPVDFEPAGDATGLAATPPASGHAPAPAEPPRFAPPAAAVPLAVVRSDRHHPRDPYQPFSTIARTIPSASAWPSAHAPGYGPVEPAPPAPAPPTSSPVPVPLPIPVEADLVAREREAWWLLAPAGLYLFGALAGWLAPLMVVVSTLLLVTRPGLRPAARTLSQIVLLLVAGTVLLSFLAGNGVDGAVPLIRGLGLAHAGMCAIWYVQERSAIGAERHRRTQQSWPPPEERR